MKKQILGAFLAFLAAGTCALAQTDETEQQTFVDKAAAGGRYEVDAGRIAKDRSNNAQLVAFADRMIADHGKINAELKSLLDNRRIVGVNGLPEDLDQHHKTLLERLKAARANVFDQVYYDQQVAAHEEAIALFKRQSESGTAKELNDWAGAILPLLREHQAQLKKINLTPDNAAAIREDDRQQKVRVTRSPEASQTISDAVTVVQQMKNDPEVARLLERSKGVYIVPDFGRAALGIGVRGGTGVMVTHADGEWRSPAFYNFGGISVGAQAGASGGSIAYLLMSDSAIKSFHQDSNFSLNANAGLSVVNYSANAQGSYGKGDVIVWSDTEGLFAGVSVGISDIVWNSDENRNYYGDAVSPMNVPRAPERYLEARRLTTVLR